VKDILPLLDTTHRALYKSTIYLLTYLLTNLLL